LSAPLYVDSFPAPVIALLEHLAEQSAELRAAAESTGSAVRFIVLIQCGFPEKKQNALALAIAKRFAKEVGWDWLGGLALGGVDTYGKSAGDALGLVAASIADGKPVPQINPRKAMPMWLYRFGGNFMWRSAARKNGVRRRLRDRPHAH
jgi:hypothetical protein